MSIFCDSCNDDVTVDCHDCEQHQERVSELTGLVKEAEEAWKQDGRPVNLMQYFRLQAQLVRLAR